jgi:hypothetical protein
MKENQQLALMWLAVLLLAIFLSVATSYISVTTLEITNMTHGHPDFHRTGGTKTSFPVSDLGELAARLGSINTFDRRGDVIFMDDFEASTLKWDSSTSGAGASVARTSTFANGGTYALQLITGDANGNSATMQRYFPLHAKQRIGVEAGISNSADLSYIGIVLRWYDGTNYHNSNFQYEVSTGSLQVTDHTGAMTTIASGITIEPVSHLFHHIKLVVDFNSDKYVRLMIDGVEYDISHVGARTVASASGPYGYLQIAAVNGAAGNRGIIVDDVIITINEP